MPIQGSTVSPGVMPTAHDLAPFATVLACPVCRAPLGGGEGCRGCGREFSRSEHGQLDFRPAGRTLLRHEADYEPTFGRFPWEKVTLEWPDLGFAPDPGPGAEIVERHLLAAVPRAEQKGAIALDIGCGPDRQRFRHGLGSLGYCALGLDIAGPAPDALADAHQLPVRDASIDLLMTSAVWEHLKHPWIAMAEAARVAKPGAAFVGAVAYNEPFHISYFHHSPLAVYELLESTGFDVGTVVLSDTYWAGYAHLDMGYVGLRIPRVLHGVLAGAIRQLALFPATLKGQRQRGRLAFARSHSAAVGFLARRRG